MEFEKFGSIARLSRDIIITEKIDGTNAQVYIEARPKDSFKPENWGNMITYKDVGYNTVLLMFAGKRNGFCTPTKDNYGFAQWVSENSEELFNLGIGRHYGEWWGQGIQCKYGMDKKVFSLFNIKRWSEERPECCNVVPVLYEGEFNTNSILEVMDKLQNEGSVVAPGFMNPEGIVIFHTQSGHLYKKTFKSDEKGKSYGS